MSFWTDLKKSGQEAAGKAKDLAEVTKLQLAQKEQERKLEQLYAQLGKSYYETAAQEESDPFLEQLRCIAQTLEEIETCKQQQLLGRLIPHGHPNRRLNRPPRFPASSS